MAAAAAAELCERAWVETEHTAVSMCVTFKKIKLRFLFKKKKKNRPQLMLNISS